MNRLEQDAADSLYAHEAWREAERARWARAKPAVMSGVWAPALTEQQKQEFEQYSKLHQLPF